MYFFFAVITLHFHCHLNSKAAAVVIKSAYIVNSKVKTETKTLKRVLSSVYMVWFGWLWQSGFWMKGKTGALKEVMLCTLFLSTQVHVLSQSSQ
jgi:hypothetical protein